MPRRSVVEHNVPTNHTLPKVVKRIKFKTLNQKRFYKAIEDDRNNIIMAHALAGAGKTTISIQKGLEMLLHRSEPIDKMVIINPKSKIKRTFNRLRVEELNSIYNVKNIYI